MEGGLHDNHIDPDLERVANTTSIILMTLHVINVIGGSILLWKLRRHAAVRARGAVFLVVALLISLVNLLGPIMGIVGLQAFSCRFVVVVSYPYLPLLCGAVFVRYVRYVLFTLIQRIIFSRMLRGTSPVLGERTPETSHRSLTGAADLHTGFDHDGPNQPRPEAGRASEHCGNGVTSSDHHSLSSDPPESARTISDSNAPMKNLDMLLTAGPSFREFVVNTGTGLTRTSSSSSMSIHQSQSAAEYPRHCTCSRCGRKGFLCLLRFSSVQLQVSIYIAYLVLACIIGFVRAYTVKAFEEETCHLEYTDVFLVTMLLVPLVAVGIGVAIPPLLCLRDAVGLRWEILVVAIGNIVTSVGFYIKLAPETQEDPNFRRIRRTVLEFIVFAYYLASVLFPLVYAVKDRKKLKPYSVTALHGGLVEGEGSVELRAKGVWVSNSGRIEPHGVEAQSSGNASAAADSYAHLHGTEGVVVMLQDVWDNQRLKEQFLHFLRAEFRVQHAAFCNATAESALSVAILRGIAPFCRFVVRVFDLFFAKNSAADIFLEPKMYSWIAKNAAKCQKVLRLVSMPGMLEELAEEQKTYALPLQVIPEAEGDEERAGGDNEVEPVIGPGSLVQVPTGLPGKALYCNDIEQKAMRLTKMRPSDVVRSLRAARASVWQELETSSLPAFLSTKAGKQAARAWKHRLLQNTRGAMVVQEVEEKSTGSDGPAAVMVPSSLLLDVKE